mmetsp:Transcript_30350/g.84838  ORF Transcript_30350/g.84838 Transcript_30350/m.84838 type:complete len:941 (-) Transcript_30350:1526-4348(-)
MDYVEKLVDGVNNYFDINLATLSGAIDVIVIRQSDGTLRSSPFHVRFGKLILLRTREKVVHLKVNDIELENVRMMLGSTGEAYFVTQDEDVDNAEDDAFSRMQLTSSDGAQVNRLAVNTRNGKAAPRGKAVCRSASHTGFSPSKVGGSAGDQASPGVSKTAEDGGILLTSFLSSQLKDNPDDMAAEGAVEPPVVSGNAGRPAGMGGGTERNDRSSSKPVLISQNRFDPEVEEDDSFPASYASPMEESDSGMPRSPALSPLPFARSPFSPFKPSGFYQTIYQPRFRLSDSDSDYDDELDEDFELQSTPGDDVAGDAQTSEKKSRGWTWTWGWGSLPVAQKAQEDGSFAKAELDDILGKEDLPEDGVAITREEPQNPIRQSQLVGWWKTQDFWSDRYWTTNESTEWFEYEKEKEQRENEEAQVGEGAGPYVGDDLGLTSNDSDVGRQQSECAVEISLCCAELKKGNSSPRTVERVFREHRVSREVFFSRMAEDPKFLQKDEYCYRVNGAVYFSWEEAGPCILSLVAFQCPLPVREERGASSQKVGRAEVALSDMTAGGQSSQMEVEDMPRKPPPQQQANRGWLSWLWGRRRNADPNMDMASHSQSESGGSAAAPPSLRGVSSNAVDMQSAPAIPLHAGDSKETVPANSPPKPLTNEEVASLTKSATDIPVAAEADGVEPGFHKTVRPPTNILEMLHLKPGCNKISYIVDTEFRGRQEIHATMWLWNYDAKLVVSDIDGTITRSDVFGQILPFLGKDWTHSGVSELYSLVHKAGYKLMYLSSRAIGQAALTKTYIERVRQGDHTLPPGPVLLSPDRLLTSFNREVILRKPELFKIAVLKDIRSLFPTTVKPYYAGFGNRMTDVVSYQEAGTPLGKVFMINPSGEIRIPVKSTTYKKSYAQMTDLVNHMFPHVTEKSFEEEEYMDANYWGIPHREVDDVDLDWG